MLSQDEIGGSNVRHMMAFTDFPGLTHLNRVAERCSECSRGIHLTDLVFTGICVAERRLKIHADKDGFRFRPSLRDGNVRQTSNRGINPTATIIHRSAMQ
jgi:hypothetical protein